GTGTNTLSYASSFIGVTVNLGNGTVSGGDAQGDVISNFTNITGSSFGDDALFGNGFNNLIQSTGGNDYMFGGGGSDTLLGGLFSNDTLEGGAGGDGMNGGFSGANHTLSYASSPTGVLVNLGNGAA